MNQISHDPPTVPAASGGYVNALEVGDAGRTLYISGQIPENRQGDIPKGVEEQCRQIWRNVVSCLESAGLSVSDLVHVRTYLSERSFAAANTAVRNEVLGDHRPALTVVIAEIFDSRWLLEIEAVAVGT